MNPLTHRERQVLQQLKLGLKMQDIANQLCISYGTVDSHLKSIYRKLEVRSGIQAVVKAMEDDLI